MTSWLVKLPATLPHLPAVPTDWGREMFLNMQSPSTEAILVLLVMALVNCFFGYVLFRVVIAVEGFLIGGLIGLLGAAALGLGGDAVWPSVVAGLVSGIILGLLAWMLYRLAFALLTGALATVIAAFLLNPQPAVTDWGIAAAVGIGLAIVAFLSLKPIIILFTGAGGGAGAVYYAATLWFGGPEKFWNATFAHGLPLPTAALVAIVAVGVLSVLGITTQFRLGRKGAPDSPKG